MSIYKVGNGFAASVEFTKRHGALDAKGFVDQLYIKVLDRKADPKGMQT